MKIRIVKTIPDKNNFTLPSDMIGKIFEVKRQDHNGLWVKYQDSEMVAINGEYETLEEEDIGNLVDKKKLIEWLEHEYKLSRHEANEAMSHMIEGVNLGKVNLLYILMNKIKQGKFDKHFE